LLLFEKRAVKINARASAGDWKLQNRCRVSE